MLLEHHHLERALRTTGIPFRFGHCLNHWNIIPARNLKPWTPEQQAALEAVAVKIGGLVTHSLVKPDFSTFMSEPGKGFRVYTGSGTDTMNLEGFREITGEPAAKEMV